MHDGLVLTTTPLLTTPPPPRGHAPCPCADPEGRPLPRLPEQEADTAAGWRAQLPQGECQPLESRHSSAQAGARAEPPAPACHASSCARAGLLHPSNSPAGCWRRPQIEGLPVYGVAIPTTRGLRNVLEAVGATQGARAGNSLATASAKHPLALPGTGAARPATWNRRSLACLWVRAGAACPVERSYRSLACQRGRVGAARRQAPCAARPATCTRIPAGRRRVLWHNMREEPVIYINGKPYVVRAAGRPFANLEYTGIDRSRVEDMEVRHGARSGHPCQCSSCCARRRRLRAGTGPRTAWGRARWRRSDGKGM